MQSTVNTADYINRQTKVTYVILCYVVTINTEKTTLHKLSLFRKHKSSLSSVKHHGIETSFVQLLDLFTQRLSEFDILNKITLHEKIQRANLESRLIYLKGRNFHDSEDFSHFSSKLLSSKKFYQTFKTIDFAKYQLFLDTAKYFSKFEEQKNLAIYYSRKNFCT